MGRKSIITREFCDSFCELLEEGNTISRCCEELGINQPQYYIWKKKAEDGIEPFKSFIERTEKIREEIPVTISNRQKSKLTQELCDVICENLRRGNYLTTSCRASGISTSTYYSWKKKGEKGEEPYATFLRKTDEAEAEGEMACLEVIYNSAIENGNWLSGAWILERKYPNRYGKRERVDLQTDNDFKLEISTARSPYEMGADEKKLLKADRED